MSAPLCCSTASNPCWNPHWGSGWRTNPRCSAPPAANFIHSEETIQVWLAALSFSVIFFFSASCNFSPKGLKAQLWGNIQQYFLCIWQGSLLVAKGQLYRPDLIVWQILYQLARSGESQINPVWKSESPILCFSHVINTSTVCAHFIQISCLNPASCLLVGSAASKGP